MASQLVVVGMMTAWLDLAALFEGLMFQTRPLVGLS